MRPAAASQAAAAGASAPARAGASATAATKAAPAGGGQGSGGPLREFRDRLVADMALSPAQIDKVDAVLAEARPRFAELRSLSEDDRPKARERILAELRARIAEQLTPEQRPKYQQLVAEVAGRQSTRGRIYLLGADNKPVAYNVRLGITDGVSTELLVGAGSPDAAAITEGATVVTGVLGAGVSPTSGAQQRTGGAGPRPPF